MSSIHQLSLIPLSDVPASSRTERASRLGQPDIESTATAPSQRREVELLPTEVAPHHTLQLRILTHPRAEVSLAESLYKCGQIAPILVRPPLGQTSGPYIILAGHRRAAAHRRLVQDGRTIDRDPASRCAAALRAIVCDLSDATALRVAIDENERRDDLSALERAYAVGRSHAALAVDRGAAPSVQELARFLDRAVGTTSEQLRIAQPIPLEVAALAIAGQPDFRAIDAEVAWRAASRWSHALLHQAATAIGEGNPDRALELLRSTRGAVARQTDRADSRLQSTVPTLDKPFSLRLSRPLGTYAPALARAHAEHLVSAGALLARHATGEAVSTVTVRNGVAILVCAPVEDLSPAECNAALAQLDELARALRSRRMTARQPV